MNFCGKTRGFWSWRVQKFIFRGTSGKPVPPCLYAPHEQIFTKDVLEQKSICIYEQYETLASVN